LHQLLKLDYLAEAERRGWPNRGLGNRRNNRNTLSFLGRAPAAQAIERLLGGLGHALKDRGVGDRYRLLRRLYTISPSVHELWFFDSHFRLRVDNIIQGRLGLKTLLTAHASGNHRLGKAVLTYVAKNAILLENQYRGRGIRGLLEVEPERNALERSAQLIRRYQGRRPGDQEGLLRSGLIEEVLATAHGLLRDAGYAPITLGNLATKDRWLFYAPCAINEGPLFIPGGQLLPSMLADSLDRVSSRDALGQHLIVWDYLSEDSSLAASGQMAAWRLRIRELLASSGKGDKAGLEL